MDERRFLNNIREHVEPREGVDRPLPTALDECGLGEAVEGIVDWGSSLSHAAFLSMVADAQDRVHEAEEISREVGVAVDIESSFMVLPVFPKNQDECTKAC